MPPSHGASSPHDSRTNSHAPEDAHIGLELQRACENRALQQVVNAGHVNSPPAAVAANASIYGGSCLAFSPELRRAAWPHKFRPELPKRYDGTKNPVELEPALLLAEGLLASRQFLLELLQASSLCYLVLPRGVGA